jgi:virginiamycin A acetyltransferase
VPDPFPSPNTVHPVRTCPTEAPTKGTVFLKPASIIRWTVGDYSYASAHASPDDWAAHLAPYLYPGSAERLILGRFCQIADGVQLRHRVGQSPP